MKFTYGGNSVMSVLVCISVLCLGNLEHGKAITSHRKLWNAIIYPCHWYLLLTHKSPYKWSTPKHFPMLHGSILLTIGWGNLTLCNKLQWHSNYTRILSPNEYFHQRIRSSAVLTRSNIVRYYINNYWNWGRISIRCPDPQKTLGCLLWFFLRKLTGL